MRRIPAALSAATAAVLLATAAPAAAADGADEVPSAARVVATGLADPYEVVWGPDGRLWVTERSGARVTRIDPATGETAPALELPRAVHTAGGDDGVLGLALHPRLLTGTGEDWVYVAYTYDADPTDLSADHRVRIDRYTLDPATGRLHSLDNVLAGLPASDAHQGGRLHFGPDGKLYYAVGDQGNNEGDRACVVNRAQRLPTTQDVLTGDYYLPYQGKLLRLNPDGSVPADNPVLNGVRSHVYAYGVRDPRGLAVGPDGTVYAADRGPGRDDEITVVPAGGNLGWPYVSGHRDDLGYVWANWSASSPVPCERLRYGDRIPPSVPRQAESAWQGAMAGPALTFGTGGPPPVGPTSLTYDTASRSLLMTTTGDDSLYRLETTAGGVGAVHRLWTSPAGFTDTAVARDGSTVYAATGDTIVALPWAGDPADGGGPALP